MQAVCFTQPISLELSASEEFSSHLPRITETSNRSRTAIIDAASLAMFMSIIFCMTMSHPCAMRCSEPKDDNVLYDGEVYRLGCVALVSDTPTAAVLVQHLCAIAQAGLFMDRSSQFALGCHDIEDALC